MYLLQCGSVSFYLIQFNGIHLCLFGGDWTINFYGIVLMLGAVAGGFLASAEAKRRGYDPEIVWDLLVYLIIGGVIGARLWHIFTPPPSSIAQGFTTQFYLTHPLDMLNLRHGGLGIPGTIIGGLIALYLFARNNKSISFIEWTDIAAPGLALGQAIGRFGNYFNQELYGAPTNLPWKIYIDPQHRLAGFENQSYYHPLFAYESIWNLLNMLLLMYITRQYSEKLKKGDVFLVYLMVYPTGRFLLDFLRLDASQVMSININQTLMAVVAVCAAITLIWRHRSGADETESAAEEIPVVDLVTASSPELEAVAVKEISAAPKKTVRKSAPKTSSAKKTAAKKSTAKKPAAKKKSAE
jgi:phosphatidylglycerol:prolipoprotein diacylglycerol transferase